MLQDIPPHINLPCKSILICWAILISTSFSQSLITLTPSINAFDRASIIIYNQAMNPPQNQTFIQHSKTFNCSLSRLYSYKQNFDQYAQNSPYFITIQNMEPIKNSLIDITIASIYSSIDPLLNGTSSIRCSIFPCVLAVQNFCSGEINRFNYFDVVLLNISSLPKIFSYYVVCNQQIIGTTFEYGLAIQIVFCTVAVTIIAIYSNAWSIGGRGIVINMYLIAAFNIVIAVGAIVAIFNVKIVSVTVDVISWIFGVAGVWLCSNQVLFLLKKVDCLRKEVISIKKYKGRVLDFVSILISVGLCCGWWFSEKNWIVSDIISMAIFVASVKFLKFTSLKLAVISFVITISIQMVFVLYIAIQIKNSYNNVILNLFNSPFQLQIPTINPVYNQKCSWLPITAIIYPGALMSYMRRFDTSRNTKVYLITCVIIFFFGSLILMFITLGSDISLPFGLITEPVTLTCVSIFAWKRKQLKTLWNGKFYDQQFANKEGLKSLGLTIATESNKTQSVYPADLFAGLELKSAAISQLQRSVYGEEHMPKAKKSQKVQKFEQDSTIELKPLSMQKSYQNNSSQAAVNISIEEVQVQPKFIQAYQNNVIDIIVPIGTQIFPKRSSRQGSKSPSPSIHEESI